MKLMDRTIISYNHNDDNHILYVYMYMCQYLYVYIYVTARLSTILRDLLVPRELIKTEV